MTYTKITFVLVAFSVGAVTAMGATACTPPPPSEEKAMGTSPLNAEDKDDCAHGAIPPTKAFCGRSAGTTKTLYQCVDSSWKVIVDCGNGCQVSGFGDDQCIQQNAALPPPSRADREDGDDCAHGSIPATKAFCGRSAGTKNTLYQCVDSQWKVIVDCANGCAVSGFGDDQCVQAPAAPPPPPPPPRDDGDDCAHGAIPPTKAFCGRSAGTKDTLYQCIDSAWSAIVDCPNGCQVSGFGDDACL